MIEAALEVGAAAACVLTGGFAAESLTEAGCIAVAEDEQALLPASNDVKSTRRARVS
jgi:hypothetical protein